MNDKVLIYQMGKVGSSAIESSIKNSYHSHTFLGNFPCPEKIQLLPIERKLRHRLGLFFHGKYFKYSSGKRKIITFSRDPLARNISMFFQELPYYMVGAESFHKYQSYGRGHGLEELQYVFEHYFNHAYALEWFDKEFYNFTNIDIYQKSFNMLDGYEILSSKRFDVLLLKYESMFDAIPVIEDFIGQKINVIRKNDSSKKWYAEVYREFKESYVPSDNVVQIYNSKYAKHFGYANSDL